MKNKSKLWLAVPALFIGSFYFSDKALAEDMQPQTVYMYDTELGTESYELLIQYSNGGHSTIGQVLKDAGVATVAPGIGFGVGSGGNGYRPNVMIVIWSNETIDLEAAKTAIKSFVNVPSDPVTTNGDCAIACDGTVQPELISEPSQPEPVAQTNENLDQQPVSTQQPTPQEQPQEPVLLQDNTQPYTPPIENFESFASFIAPTDIIVQSPISNKIINNKKVVHKKKITTKKVVRHATNKTTR